MLKRSQAEIFEQIVHAIEADNVKRLVLDGSAGTGKTFLTDYIVKHFANKKAMWDDSKVWVTAPTNKALSILQKKIGTHKSVQFSTTHSALKLKKFIHPKENKVYFKPPKKNFGDPPFKKCSLAIVDECSMLNSDIVKELDKFNFPIIFVGDIKQLNPVGEEESPVFTKGYTQFSLTEIIRQGAGNPIIDLSRDLSKIWSKKANLIEEKGYLYNENKAQILSNLADVNGTDELKYLSWTNMDVDAMNKGVRELLYNKPKKVELNESIIFKESFGRYWTNQELKVETLEIKEMFSKVPRRESVYSSKGDWLNFDTHKFKVYLINGEVPVLHEDSELEFITVRQGIYTKCNSENWDWRGYFYFIDQFAKITYNHAITVHKS